MTPHNEPGLATLDGWFVAGASKRGWTTWMVGAVECTDSIYSHSKRDREREGERGGERERESKTTLPGTLFGVVEGVCLHCFMFGWILPKFIKRFILWFGSQQLAYPRAWVYYCR